jgi:integrase
VAAKRRYTWQLENEVRHGGTTLGITSNVGRSPKRALIVFDKTKSSRPRLVEMNSEVKEIILPLCKGKRPDDYVWLHPKTGRPFGDIKRAFISACHDAGIEGLVWHDLRATYGTRLGEAGFNAYDIAKLMGHANISTSQRYVRNLAVGVVRQ